MSHFKISKATENLFGEIHLDGSKSISNRVLIIRALAKESFPVHHCSSAADTRLLKTLLSSKETLLNAGAAGTTFRFLTAYLAFRGQPKILTGSDRMKQRPIGGLVEALSSLGADIQYLEKPGFPPLHIQKANSPILNKVEIAGDTSSQFITALLLIAPTFQNGLELKIKGKLVSAPYVEMTCSLMRFFGIEVEWKEDIIAVAQGSYQAREFHVEPDWSAASYWYAMAALARDADLFLSGLQQSSMQGDSICASLFEQFGLETRFGKSGLHIKKKSDSLPPFFEFDFTPCPDLAQTFIVLCAAFGISGKFKGLQTLRIKETDRCLALQQELAKLGVSFRASAPDTQCWELNGQVYWDTPPKIATYKDHRMAMSFAPLAMLKPLIIEESEVVKKSYPDFWKDLEKIGFKILETK